MPNGTPPPPPNISLSLLLSLSLSLTLSLSFFLCQFFALCPITLENRKKVNVEAFAVCQTIEKKSDQAISPSPRSYKSRGSSFLNRLQVETPTIILTLTKLKTDYLITSAAKENSSLNLTKRLAIKMNINGKTPSGSISTRIMQKYSHQN